MLKGTIPGHYSRNQALELIANSLGITKNSNEWHRIYRHLGTVFSDPTVKKQIIGSGGKTNRLKQVHKDDLYEFAKRTYQIEVPEWKSPIQKIDVRLNDIKTLLEQLDKGYINQSVFICAVRKILSI